MLMAKQTVRQRSVRRPVVELLVQLLGVAVASFFVPLLSPLLVTGTLGITLAGTWNTQVASFLAAMVALIAFRRVTAYPGARGFAYVLPTFSTTFGLATAVLLASRIPYSGTMMLVGYVASAGVTFFINYLAQRSGAQPRM